MKTEFTKQFMEDNCGCYTLEQLHSCSFMQSDIITLDSILNSEISLKDKYWFVCKRLASKEENRLIAIGAAEIVLPVFERRYPEDKRPREAIEAAKQYISGHISRSDLITRMDAAYDAAYVAYAAYAYAAANAAAAAAAANAAYAAADAADAAADAAYAADDDADIRKQLLDFLITKTLTGEKEEAI